LKLRRSTSTILTLTHRLEAALTNAFALRVAARKSARFDEEPAAGA
jgi:hypothetical protein